MRVFIIAVIAVSVQLTASQGGSGESCKHGVIPQPDGSCKCPLNLSGDLCQTQECPASDRVFCPLFGVGFCASVELFNHSLCPVMCGNCPPKCNKVCENGGTQDSLPCTCGCPVGYTGDLCETRVPDCRHVTCRNGGVVDPVTCECLCLHPGLYTGTRCEQTNCSMVVDPPGCVASLANCLCGDRVLSTVCPVLCGVCAPRCEKACHNGGTLQDDACQCACPRGYTGEFCEERLCGAPCENGGTMDVASCRCSCPVVWSGTRCQVPLCLSPPAVANADVLVVDKMAVYTCRAGSVSTAGSVHNSTCGVDGTWTPTNFACTDVTSCFLTRNGVRVYHGTLSTTNRGLTCQSWTSQSPNRHRYRDLHFNNLGETAALAGNYCRDPSGGGVRPSGRLWCYNGGSRRPRWDWCDDVPQC
ncbi:neurogenic locus notch homolog protein 1-like [Haliotis rufescens]|uniref:neurogenic locus notch homolog protein 1-like n=1 Tax=Haliotis rufescens TaxID=6454 RepID=UPI00201EA621|nr:neurogenic locus notch homolog protein 1-like [Haliotis rufescens]